MMRTLIVFVLLLFYVTPAAAQYWRSTTKDEALLYFTGDTKFITEVTWRLGGILYSERHKLEDGVFGYAALDNGHAYTGAHRRNWYTALLFNRRETAKEFGLSVGESDVKIGENRFGQFAWVSKSGKSGSCFTIHQNFGKTYGKSDSNGHQRLDGHNCWPPSRGTSAELDEFMLNLMQRMRIRN